MAKPLNSLKSFNRDATPRLIAGAVFIVLGIWLYPQLSTGNLLITLAGMGAALGLLYWSNINSQKTLLHELTQIHNTLAPLLPTSTVSGSNTENTSGLSSSIREQLQQLSKTQHSLSTSATGVVEQARYAQQAATQVTNELAEQQHASQSATQCLDDLRSVLGQLLDSADETLEISKRSEADGESGKLAMTEAMSGVMALGESVNETGVKVETLGENSEAIGGIVNVIKSVAEQTNLLALNAAIEAARAGEQGRGFAVVADEVRSLANKTQDSAQEIEDLIQQLLRNVESANASIHNSMKLGEKSDELIEGMVVSYSEIVGHMSEIETLAKAMTNTSAHGQQSTNDIAQHIQQLESGLTNTLEQLNQFDAASHELLAQGEQLNNLRN